MMNDNGRTPPPEFMPPMGSQAYVITPPPRSPTGEVSVVRLNMPIRWVAGIVFAVAGGVLSIGGVLWRTEAHISEHAAHLGPEVAAAGGVVTKRDLRMVLRAMKIQCVAGPGGGMACTVEIPREAD